MTSFCMKNWLQMMKKNFFHTMKSYTQITEMKFHFDIDM